MTSRDFVHWLQGAFELGKLSIGGIDGEEVEMIREHVALVSAEDFESLRFIEWLSGFLDACGGEVTAEDAKKIRVKLDGLFDKMPANLAPQLVPYCPWHPVSIPSLFRIVPNSIPYAPTTTWRSVTDKIELPDGVTAPHFSRTDVKIY